MSGVVYCDVHWRKLHAHEEFVVDYPARAVRQENCDLVLGYYVNFEVENDGVEQYFCLHTQHHKLFPLLYSVIDRVAKEFAVEKGFKAVLTHTYGWVKTCMFLETIS